MSEGWRCPGCGTCYAPWVPQCECNKTGISENTVEITDIGWGDSWGTYTTRVSELADSLRGDQDLSNVTRRDRSLMGL